MNNQQISTSHGKWSEAELIETFVADDGAKIEVLKADGKFWFKKNGCQVGGARCDQTDAVHTAFAVAYLGERL